MAKKIEKNKALLKITLEQLGNNLGKTLKQHCLVQNYIEKTLGKVVKSLEQCRQQLWNNICSTMGWTQGLYISRWQTPGMIVQ